VVYAKTLRMLATEPELDLASLGLLAAPTLVLQGDRDEVTLKERHRPSTGPSPDAVPDRRLPTPVIPTSSSPRGGS
jgi:hypothetical protein